MNKKKENQKIKVNSIAEMLAEMRKLKNSGGEWKVLERHTKWTVGRDEKNKDSTSGFILSNGTKKVDIVCEENDYDIAELDTIFGGKEDYQKLREIFPEDKTPFLSRKYPEVGYSSSLKVIGEIGKEHTTIMRLFNAWSLDDVRKILVDYYMANKAEIDQFIEEKNFPVGVDHLVLLSPWLEVAEDDQLFYIWVGKRDTKKGYYWGGGEWEICLRKSDLMGKYDINGHKINDYADSEGVQNLKKFLAVHWMTLTDAGDGNRGNKYTIAGFENHPVGFDPDCCDQNGNSAFPSERKLNDNQKPDPISGQNSNPSQPFSLSKSAKELVRRYMEQNNIFRLTLDNNKLVVEYNNSSKKEKKEINSQQLKAIQDYLKEHNNSVDFEQLKSSSNSAPQPNPDYTLWIVGGIGLVLVAGIFVYWIRKRKNK